MKANNPISICELYPELPAAQLEKAEANLRRYLAVLLRMAERLQSEGRSINGPVDGQFASTSDQLYHPIGKRSNSESTN